MLLIWNVITYGVKENNLVTVTYEELPETGKGLDNSEFAVVGLLCCVLTNGFLADNLSDHSSMPRTKKHSSNKPDILSRRVLTLASEAVQTPINNENKQSKDRMDSKDTDKNSDAAECALITLTSDVVHDFATKLKEISVMAGWIGEYSNVMMMRDVMMHQKA
jgi:hypothetical protein